MSASPSSAALHHPETEPFRAAARQGRFLLKYCSACAKPHWYPRALCPFCWAETEWRQASGRASIYSYSVTRGKDGAAHVMAYVTLEEGPIMMTNIVDCDPGGLAIGQPLRVAFRSLAGDGEPVPVFIPA